MMYIMQEPLWGQNILLFMHTVMQYPFFAYWTPIFADIFVFVYPVYLLVIYVYGMIYTNLLAKNSAFWIFWVAMVTASVNIVIQLFIVKDRPDVALDLTYHKKEVLLHKYLPEASFPSDHAALSMAIAVATLLWGIRYKKRGYIYFSIFLFAISLIMGWARITIGVHRPTDIIAGYTVGILVPLLLFHRKIYPYLQSWCIDPLIKLEQWVWKKICH